MNEFEFDKAITNRDALGGECTIESRDFCPSEARSCTPSILRRHPAYEPAIRAISAFLERLCDASAVQAVSFLETSIRKGDGFPTLALKVFASLPQDDERATQAVRVVGQASAGLRRELVPILPVTLAYVDTDGLDFDRTKRSKLSEWKKDDHLRVIRTVNFRHNDS